MPGLAPGDALARVSHLPGAALVRHRKTWVVTAEPAEQVAGGDVWEALGVPIGPSGSPGAMANGWIALLAYDAARSVERLPVPVPDPGGPAAARAARYPAVLVLAGDGTARIEAADAASGRRLLDALREVPPPLTAPALVAAPATSLPAAAYVAAVEQARELIRAGDCYQVNLAQRLSVPWPASGVALARAIWTAAGPAEYQGYLATPDGVLVSASPELLVRTEDRAGHPIALSSPIKGTAPPGELEALRGEKNLAEHVMIVDLIRNDLGRVALPGGVSVPRMLAPLRIGYAEHLVSDVEARLRPDVTAADVLRAMIPGGSVTGCPKIRAMEIIRELEPANRGPAFGSLVAVGRDGSLDASVLIRTAWLTPDGEARYWSGGAIVWDSDPEAERREAQLKATPFLRAIGAET